MKLAVVGAGSWGSALTIALSKIAQELKLYCRTLAQMQTINSTRLNGGYLPNDVKFASNVVATNEFADVVTSDLVVIATPINALRGTIRSLCALKPSILPSIIWLCKGFESNSGLLPHQIIKEECANYHFDSGALLGPSFAHDVALSRITGLTLASDNIDFALKWAKILSTIENFRVYATPDVIGAEICAATKNIIAIAAGILDGLSLGSNARAALISRSLGEITRLVTALGGNYKTVYGLSGVGDLLLTCTGNLSRNRNVGLKLAQGQKLEQIIIDLGHVAEGVLTCKEVYNLSQKLAVEMPITKAVYDVLYNHHDIKATIESLLLREPKLEY
jgi:glycerol-3-phosphate dehydrogenase (NAD(P)+)